MPDGKLAYSGGLTGARGHEGDNDGERAVLALAGGRVPPRNQEPVYGCSLEEKVQAQRTEAAR
jgi:hypothetical protein